MQIVADTSAVMAVILNEPRRGALVEATRGAEVHAPGSLPWEVGNALSALMRRGRLDARQARAAFSAFREIPIRLRETDVDAVLAISASFGCYAYDAYVLECALAARAPLLSLDGALCEIARALGISILEA